MRITKKSRNNCNEQETTLPTAKRNEPKANQGLTSGAAGPCGPGLGGYVADTEDVSNPIAQAALDDWIAMTGKINEPPYGGASNSAFLALVRAIDERLSCHEEPLKSDKLYDEPQAIYPMEMRQD